MKAMFFLVRVFRFPGLPDPSGVPVPCLVPPGFICVLMCMV